MIQIIMEVIYDVMINALTFMATCCLAFIVLIFRYSNFFKYFRKFINPKRRVYVKDIRGFQSEKLTQSNFTSPVDQSERKILVDLYSSRNNSNPHNGKSVRLDSVCMKEDKVTCKLSEVDFYDFLATNLCVLPSNSPILSIKKLILTIVKWWQSFELVDNVKKKVYQKGKIEKFDDVIENSSLANIIAVSIILIDKTGRIGIVKRTKKVAVSSGYYSATAAGTVSDSDFPYENPMESCIIREVKEELGIDLPSVQFDGCVIPKQKLQPIFCYSAKLDDTWENYLDIIKQAPDFNYETNAIYAVPVDCALSFVAKSIMTDAAAYQMQQYVEKYTTKKQNWFLAIIQPIWKNKYKLNVHN